MVPFDREESRYQDCLTPRLVVVLHGRLRGWLVAHLLWLPLFEDVVLVDLDEAIFFGIRHRCDSFEVEETVLVLIHLLLESLREIVHGFDVAGELRLEFVSFVDTFFDAAIDSLEEQKECQLGQKRNYLP